MTFAQDWNSNQMAGYESTGTAYLRNKNCMFLNKKFQDLTSFPCNFRSEVVSDSHHSLSHTIPYLFLHIHKVLAATQLTYKAKLIGVHNNLWPHLCSNTENLSQTEVCLCPGYLEGTKTLLSQLSLPILISTTGNPDRQTGREL